MKQEIVKLAKILRTDQDFLSKLERRLSYLTKKENVLEEIVLENQKKIEKSLLYLGVSKNATAKEVYNALIYKVESDDILLFNYFNQPNYYLKEEGEKILNLLKENQKIKTGFFLKEEKAKELLLKEQPKKILEYLNYQNVEEMLLKEDLYEIFSALRFIEESDWLNQVFFKQYEKLTVDDFEFREIKIKILDQKWLKAAEKFILKKWHNISHLKELGVIFIIPYRLNISGEFLRMINLIFHYLNEIPFYSKMFLKIKEVPELFSYNLVSLLRGDVLDRRLEEGEKVLWYVIQRYLAKDDENDWRLFVPHINPEALHWQKATVDLYEFVKKFNGFEENFKFWLNLDWVGDYFKDEVGQDVLISFNLVDTVMSLVKQKELIKYLYHQQEALWNKIFESYFGQEGLEKFIMDYLILGYFEL